MKAFKVTVLLLFVVLFSIGCASYSPALVRLDTFGPNTVKQVNGDMCVFMEEYATKEKCEKAFDMNLSNDGVLPLLVSLQNNGQQPIEVKTMDIILRDSDTTIKALTAEEAASKAKKNAFTRALGWSLIVPIISIPIAATASAIHTSNVNKQMVRDFTAKSFPEGVVMPNKELSGFLFFELEKKRNDLSGLLLEMTVKNVSTGELVRIASQLPSVSFKQKEDSKAQEVQKNSEAQN